jgi:HD superfamily phosphohydrolase
MGVAYLAREMYDRITSNMDETPDSHCRLATVTAGLLHDIGHGPFSHTAEETLQEIGKRFRHETMTVRIIEEAGSEVNNVLSQIDPTFPHYVAKYVNKRARKEDDDHWSYKIVSSQLDADRLDYLLRDAKFAGLQGHGFDLPRLLDMLCHIDERRIAVDRHAVEAVEAFIIMLEQVYRAIYFHPVVRGASVLLSQALRRAVRLYGDGNGAVFPKSGTGRTHPFQLLVDNGDSIDIAEYIRLGDFQVWTLIEEWQYNDDRILSDLCSRLMHRDVFKAIEIDPFKFGDSIALKQHAEQLVSQQFPWLDRDTVSYYVVTDEPSRTGYKRYDWRREASDESIWMCGGSMDACPIEEEGNKIIGALKEARHFQRIMLPREIHAQLENPRLN